MNRYSRTPIRRSLRVELLAERLLLARDSVYISEFLANNDSVLADEDGHFSDWIELHNPTSDPVELVGWSLTDAPSELTRWTFPTVTIPADGFQLVFASGKDRRDPTGELHANFKLSTDGEYLALIKPDLAIANEFSPSYPLQSSDVSFGYANNKIPLVGSDAVRSFRVPTENDSQETAWRDDVSYDDSAWQQTRGAIGYNRLGIENAGFEKNDLSIWQNRGPVNVVDQSFGVSPIQGRYMAVVTTRDSMASRAGAEFYLDLPRSTLDEVNVGDVQRVSVLKREIAAHEGTVLSFDWNYLTNDLRDGDFAFVTVSDSPTLLANSSSDIVGSSAQGYSHETGFRRFTHTFDIAGNYTIGIGVAQAVDLNDDSAIVVDNLKIDGIGDPDLSYDSILKTHIEHELSDNSTVWWRDEFQYDPSVSLKNLLLRVRYDDGFVAFINGVPVASQNAPETLRWNSAATNPHLNDQAIEFEDVFVSSSMLNPGSNLLAIQGLNGEFDDFDFLLDAQLIGVTDPVDEADFLQGPTPGSLNLSDSIAPHHIEEVEFDHSSGFFSRPFLLSMSTDDPEATIRYTTDGSAPDGTSRVYEHPIHITSNTVIRAAAIKDGVISRVTETATYLFIEDILQQSTNTAIEAGFPSTWSDYEMDPNVIGPNGRDLFDGKYVDTIRDALLSLPTMSLVMNRDDLFGDQGIFVNPLSRGAEWERPTAVELFHSDGASGFQIEAGLRVQGGISRTRSDKLSMRLSFREQYADGKLHFPLFGAGGPDEFDSIVLRSSSGEVAAGFHYIRDETLRRIEQASGNPSARGDFVHLYINGLYWGVYNTTERIDAQFAVNRDGGSKEEYDIYNADNEGTVTASHGTMAAWDRMVSLANEVGSADDEAARTAAFMKLQGRYADGTIDPDHESYLDVDNFIRYLVINVYAGNVDWPDNNYYVFRRHGPNSEGFKFVVWDAEFTFDAGYAFLRDLRVPGVSYGVAIIVDSLLTSEAFRVRFADQVHQLFSLGGALYVNADSPTWDSNHPDNNVPARVYTEVADSVRSAIVAESARWGDSRGQVDPPFTRDEDWTTIVNRNLEEFFARRSDAFLEELRSDDLYRDAPAFDLQPGRVERGSKLTLASLSGVPVYYTTDGTDPRLVDGDISPHAIPYTTPISIDQRTVIHVRSLNGTKWSAIDDGTYLIDESLPTSANLRITEINFNPHDPLPQFGETVADNDQFEFVELANVGSETVDLTGVKLVSRFGHGVDFEFGRQLLAAGQHVVVPRDLDAFVSRYGMTTHLAIGTADDNTAWVFVGDLANDGDSLRVVDANGRTIQTLSFGDSYPWPSRADGDGSSLELIDFRSDGNNPQSWRAGGKKVSGAKLEV